MRAGVPLDRGLLRAGGELPRRPEADHPGAGRAIEAGRDALPGPGRRAAVDPAALPGGGRGRGAGRGGCRRPWRGWRGTSAAIRRLGRRSAWPSGIRSSSCRWPTCCSWGWSSRSSPGSSGRSSRWGSRSSRLSAGWRAIGELAPYWWPIWPVSAACSGSAGGGRAWRRRSRPRPGRCCELFPWMRLDALGLRVGRLRGAAGALARSSGGLSPGGDAGGRGHGQPRRRSQGARQIAAAVERGEPAGEGGGRARPEGLPALAPLGAGGGPGPGLAGRDRCTTWRRCTASAGPSRPRSFRSSCRRC